jgi:hypothetical protein
LGGGEPERDREGCVTGKWRVCVIKRENGFWREEMDDREGV